MAWTERPRESLTATTTTPAPDAAVARRVADQQSRDRIAQDRARALGDVRHRPEDSAPAIRHLLGYDRPPRPPARWELQPGWDGQPRYVRVGPVDAASEPRGRARV